LIFLAETTLSPITRQYEITVRIVGRHGVARNHIQAYCISRVTKPALRVVPVSVLEYDMSRC